MARMTTDTPTLQSLTDALSIDFESLKSRKIRSEDRLESLLEWSSLNALLIMVRIKQHYKVELMPGELRAAVTFGDLVLLIQSKL